MAASEASLEHSTRYLQSSNSNIVAAMGALSFCAAMHWVRLLRTAPLPVASIDRGMIIPDTQKYTGSFKYGQSTA